MTFDEKAIDFAKQGNPSFNTFKNRLFAEQKKIHPGTFT